MRHYFIVNPHSGPEDCTQQVRQALAGFENQFDFEIYVTKESGDGTRFVREKCAESSEPVRFYACGGDGTLNEVVNGAAEQKHAQVGCFPCGSGNDFVKYFGGKKHFMDLGALMAGEAKQIDVIRANGHYAINVVNFGFESVAANRMAYFRRFKLFKNQRAYYPTIVMTLFDGMRHRCRMKADGESMFDGELLLCSLANARYVGGSFLCAPRANLFDGLLEVCLVRTLSLLKVPKAIGIYQRGKHLESDYLKPYIVYRQAKKIEVEADKDFLMCLDGEIISANKFVIENIPGGLNFIVPRGVEYMDATAAPQSEEQAV